MTVIADRIAKYLLARLRRVAIHNVYEDAAEAGLLETAFIDRKEQSGLIWLKSATKSLVLSGDEALDRDRIARLLRTPRPTSPEDGEIVIEDEDQPRSAAKGRWAKAERADGGEDRQAALTPIAERDALLRTLRTLARRPSVADAAVALLLAQAIG